MAEPETKAKTKFKAKAKTKSKAKDELKTKPKSLFEKEASSQADECKSRNDKGEICTIKRAIIPAKNEWGARMLITFWPFHFVIYILNTSSISPFNLFTRGRFS